MVTDVNRLRAVYELDDKPAVAGFRRVQQASTQANAKIAGDMAKVEGSVNRLSGAFGNTNNVRQFGQQMSQVGQQAAATGNILQAMAIQLPDIAMIFGGAGAAMAGAGVALGISLIPAMVEAIGQSKSLKDQMKDLETSTDAMADAAELAAMPLTKLRDLYGDLGVSVQQAAREMAAFAAVKAERDAISITRALGGEIGFKIPDAVAAQPIQWNGRVNLDRQRMAIEAQTNAVEALRKKTGATEEQFERLRMAINRTNSSNSLEAAANDATNLARVLAEIGQNDGISDAQFRRLSDWAAMAQSVAEQSLRQIEAEKSERQKLIDTYDKTTQSLKSNAGELKRAEDERAKAVAAGLEGEVSMWDRIIDKIQEARREIVLSAQESDAAFAKMAANFPSMDEFKRGTSAGYYGAQYIAERTRGAGSRNEELVRATAAAAEQLGIATKDLLSIIMLESGGDPSIRGGAGNRHIGLIQFGPEEQKKYGAAVGQTITEQMDAVVRYLIDRGVKPGMALPNIYAAVNAGQAHLTNRGDRRNGGIVDNIYEFTTGPKMDRYLNEAEGLLAAYPDIAKAATDAATAQKGFSETLSNSSRTLAENAAALGKSAEEAAYLAKKNELINAAVKAGIDPATQMAEIERQAQAAGTNARLAEEVKLREKNSEAMRRMGEQLAANLVDQQKEAELARWAADQTAQINASGMGEQQKAAALAAVTAEVEKQRLAYKLMAQAKAQNVDLDAVMDQSAQAQIAAATGLTAGAITYRQAIEALGVAKAQDVLLTQQRAAAEQSAAETQAFWNEQQQTFKNGLVDAIMAGENFTEVLKNMALQMLKAGIQAELMAGLFGEGPLAGKRGTTGGGLLSGLTNLLFRADGGPIYSGRPTVVGERGPELIVPRSSGYVIPNHQLGGSGGSMTFAPTIHVGGEVTQADLAAIYQAMAKERAAFFKNVKAATAEIGTRTR